jgi:hypothetical protein
MNIIKAYFEPQSGNRAEVHTYIGGVQISTSAAIGARLPDFNRLVEAAEELFCRLAVECGHQATERKLG